MHVEKRRDSLVFGDKLYNLMFKLIRAKTIDQFIGYQLRSVCNRCPGTGPGRTGHMRNSGIAYQLAAVGR